MRRVAPRPAVLGIDAGGSATRVLIVDDTGRCLGDGCSAGSNPTAHPPEAWSKAVSEALAQALAGSGPVDVRSAVAGIAGGNAEAAAAFERVIRAAVSCSGPVQVTGDVVVAFAAGTAEAHGTVLVAGTGAAAAAMRDRMPVTEADGYGWLLGDAGSGFWIGREAVRCVLAELDGHEPGTRLRPLVTEALTGQVMGGASAAEARQAIIRAANARPAVQLSRLAPLVSQCAAAGDQAALRIARGAVALLIQTVSMVRLPDAATPVVVTGSIAAGDHLIGGLLRRELQDRWPGCTRAAHDGAAGAAWLALTALPGGSPQNRAALHRVVTGQLPRLQPARQPGPPSPGPSAKAVQGPLRRARRHRRTAEA